MSALRPLQPPRPPRVPSDDELAKRGLAFERVHPDFESPVRLRHHGAPIGVVPIRSAAAHLIAQLSVCLLVAGIAMGWVAAHAADETPRRARGTDTGFLEAVSVVEDWQGRRGAAGEIGPYQMLPGTWATYTGTAEERAWRHLVWLRRELARRGVDPSPFNLALCWNAGLSATVRGRAPVTSYDYARRVCAVMERRANR